MFSTLFGSNFMVSKADSKSDFSIFFFVAFKNYEIEQAIVNGKGLLGIYIHNLKNLNGDQCTLGENPFSQYYVLNNKLCCKNTIWDKLKSRFYDGAIQIDELIPCYNPPILTVKRHMDISKKIFKIG